MSLSSTNVRRGTNWGAIHRHCFITALDDHNPWIAATNDEALTIWNKATDQANTALTQSRREKRNHGAFAAQWRKMVKDVQEQKQVCLKATGANFDEEALFATLYNLVNLYNTSSIKLAFLKSQNTFTTPTQLERIQRQKRKQAVSVAAEAGQTGQTLALQRLRDRQTSASLESPESQEMQADAEAESEPDNRRSSSLSHASPTPKRRRTPKAQIGADLVEGINKLIYLQASALGKDQQPDTTMSQHSEHEVGQIKSQVSQLQSDVAGINGKMDVLIQLLMQQQSSGPVL
ncbi:conserved hypothetical protein [Sporisorium reilianum SRZ2]|uniref:No apical meristem-associated C-terminal domain-containing protein n=1 Tax=Sporisorium reilianum (strain SRZ2) TaxID=999809 RepID=E7A0A5_SPORE|nr:conserved hypothetical protein [Sporisorium reilianum SRZ2]